MLLIHPQFSPITAIKLCNCFKVPIGIIVTSLSGFLPLLLLSLEGHLYLCIDWVYWCTIQSIFNNFNKIKGIFNACFLNVYPSTNRCPSFCDTLENTPGLWLNLCLKFTALLRDLTDNCMCGVHRWGSSFKIMFETIIAHSESIQLIMWLVKHMFTLKLI